MILHLLLTALPRRAEASLCRIQSWDELVQHP